jgi:hypothetical protein
VWRFGGERIGRFGGEEALVAEQGGDSESAHAAGGSGQKVAAGLQKAFVQGMHG